MNAQHSTKMKLKSGDDNRILVSREKVGKLKQWWVLSWLVG